MLGKYGLSPRLFDANWGKYFKLKNERRKVPTTVPCGLCENKSIDAENKSENPEKGLGFSHD